MIKPKRLSVLEVKMKRDSPSCKRLSHQIVKLFKNNLYVFLVSFKNALYDSFIIVLLK